MTSYIAHNVQVIANNIQFEWHSQRPLQMPQQMLQLSLDVQLVLDVVVTALLIYVSCQMKIRVK